MLIQLTILELINKNSTAGIHTLTGINLLIFKTTTGYRMVPMLLKFQEYNKVLLVLTKLKLKQKQIITPMCFIRTEQPLTQLLNYTEDKHIALKYLVQQIPLVLKLLEPLVQLTGLHFLLISGMEQNRA